MSENTSNTTLVAAVEARTRAFIDAYSPSVGAAPSLTRAELAKTIDHTVLKADSLIENVDALCDEAKSYGFASVCVNSCWVPRCAEALEGSGVLVCSVIGFPLGAMATEAKTYEAKVAVEAGAAEIDMVINIGALKSGEYAMVCDDVAAVADACHAADAHLKVIIEAAMLTDEEKVAACLLAVDAGADYVKTSTGFGPGGATLEDVALMRAVVGPEIGVKAAGGIRTTETALTMLAAGASRIGASSGIAIVEGLA